MQRRPFLAATASLPFASAASRAQASWPARPVRMIVPFAPGGASDFLARVVAEPLGQSLGQPIVIENRPGAGSNIGVDALAKAPPDGYTLGLGNVASHAINPHVYKERLPFDPLKDFAPVSNLAITPNILVVNPRIVPARTLPEFVAWLKEKPDRVAYGSSGVGTTLHVGMELFLARTGTRMTHVPYRGSGPMLTDLLGGQVAASMDGAATSWSHAREGRLVALAITTPERGFFAPDLPTLGETYPGLQIVAWHGLMAPAGTPRPIVERVSTEVRRILSAPDVVKRFQDQSVVAAGSTPDDFTAFIAAQYALFGPVVAAAGITAES